MNDVMKVLSLWQPWATLCVAPDPAVGRPPKLHETRHWPPDHPLPIRVAIHATLKSSRATYELLAQHPFKCCLERAGFYAGDVRPFVARRHEIPRGLKPLPFGAIVGVATIVTASPTFPPRTGGWWAKPADAFDRAFGDWSPGRYAWGLAETALLPEPIPFRGRQQPLYPVPHDILALITQQLQAVA